MKREVDSICADIYEWQPNLVNWQMQSSGKVNKPLRPKAHLSCASGQKISSIKFASFGTPEGSCGNFRQGSCHAFHSYDVFERVYLRTFTRLSPFLFLLPRLCLYLIFVLDCSFFFFPLAVLCWPTNLQCTYNTRNLWRRSVSECYEETLGRGRLQLMRKRCKPKQR